jgi:hypothetical protein
MPAGFTNMPSTRERDIPDELAAQVEGTVSAREVDQLVAGASPGGHGRSHPT